MSKDIVLKELEGSLAKLSFGNKVKSNIKISDVKKCLLDYYLKLESQDSRLQYVAAAVAEIANKITQNEYSNLKGISDSNSFKSLKKEYIDFMDQFKHEKKIIEKEGNDSKKEVEEIDSKAEVPTPTATPLLSTESTPEEKKGTPTAATLESEEAEQKKLAKEAEDAKLAKEAEKTKAEVPTTAVTIGLSIGTHKSSESDTEKGSTITTTPTATPVGSSTESSSESEEKDKPNSPALSESQPEQTTTGTPSTNPTQPEAVSTTSTTTPPVTVSTITPESSGESSSEDAKTAQATEPLLDLPETETEPEKNTGPKNPSVNSSTASSSENSDSGSEDDESEEGSSESETEQTKTNEATPPVIAHTITTEEALTHGSSTGSSSEPESEPESEPGQTTTNEATPPVVNTSTITTDTGASINTDSSSKSDPTKVTDPKNTTNGSTKDTGVTTPPSTDIEDTEQKRLADEAEKKRLAEEAEKKRLADEAEKKKAAEELKAKEEELKKMQEEQKNQQEALANEKDDAKKKELEEKLKAEAEAIKNKEKEIKDTKDEAEKKRLAEEAEKKRLVEIKTIEESKKPAVKTADLTAANATVSRMVAEALEAGKALDVNAILAKLPAGFNDDAKKAMLEVINIAKDANKSNDWKTQITEERIKVASYAGVAAPAAGSVVIAAGQLLPVKALANFSKLCVSNIRFIAPVFAILLALSAYGIYASSNSISTKRKVNEDLCKKGVEAASNKRLRTI